ERGGLAFVHARLFAHKRRRGARGATLRGLVMVGLSVLHAGCATLGLGGGGVDRGAVDAILDAPPLDQMSFGVLAVDASSGRTLYARNARRHFVPASNEKLLVTSTAVSLLGADYRYRTPVFAVGAQRGDTLDGSLVVVGSGDPTLSDRFYDSSGAALAQIADSLRAVGIRHVTGGLVVDASAWDSTTVGPTWEVDDLPYAYGATGGAFALDQGELRVVLRGGPEPGDPVAVTWTPTGTRDFVLNRLVTAPTDSSTRVRSAYWPESRHVVLTGRVAADTVDTMAFAMRDPVRQATATLLRVLQERGVTVDDGWRVAWDSTAVVEAGCTAGHVADCRDAREVGALVSPPLMEIVKGILEPSQNWMTEQLIRTLGAQRGEGGSWRQGIDVMTRFLVDSVGIDSLDITPRDGSGLSSHNLVTPRAVVRILQYMASRPHGAEFRHALAEPGEEDSTLERRLAGFEGRLFAKTGTISNVNSLSGYLVRDDGSEVIFSLLSNGSGLPSARVRAALDNVVRVLAGRHP
ncbi:MAG: D-alanyl-D-alanine carboxypeptidase/D-alanyl-D-alanine-endopeptidase, partial [Gemmatimonadota bacterium]